MKTTDMTPAHGRWHVLVPVKEPGRAKSRLTSVAGEQRAVLALAFARDTVGAALGCDVVASVTVVTGDPLVGSVMSADGARVVPEGAASGLNHALGEALHTMPAPGRIAVVLGDLPAITPAALGRALMLAARHGTAFVPDADGTGTTILTARHCGLLTPRFGPGSASAHAETGATCVTGPGLRRVRRDVDDLASLHEAIRLGVGEHTRAAADAIGLYAREAHDIDRSALLLESTAGW